MAISNSRMTIASILGAIQTTANTVSSTLDAANHGVGMLNTMVTSAATRQKKRAIADDYNFEQTLIEDKAKELTESRLQVLAYCAQSTEHNTQYQAAYKELQSLFAKP